MRALLCKQYGLPDTLVVEEVPDPVPGPGEIVVDMKAAGVNFPDVLIIQNKYQFKAEPPFSPGAEFAGVVSALGEGVTHLKVGDHIIGSTTYGAFCEKVKMSAARAVSRDEKLILRMESMIGRASKLVMSTCSTTFCSSSALAFGTGAFIGRVSLIF